MEILFQIFSEDIYLFREATDVPVKSSALGFKARAGPHVLHQLQAMGPSDSPPTSTAAILFKVRMAAKFFTHILFQAAVGRSRTVPWCAAEALDELSGIGCQKVSSRWLHTDNKVI